MTVTPSPQSVVVPVDDLLFYKLKDLITEQSEGEWTDEMVVKDAHHFANHLRPLLASAPAPSSLAGGEAESRALDWMEWVAQGALDTDDVQLSGAEIIQHAEIELASIRKRAALSPEAPAREGEWFTTDVVEVEYHDGNGETHMSPWEVDWGNVARWRPQPDANTITNEAASATEDDDDASTYAPSISGLSDYLWNQAQAADSVEGRCILEMWREAVDALRTRSSAPEAREGEAVPFGYWVEHNVGESPVMIRRSSFVPTGRQYRVTPLYTHPAAPSADKLRIAVEALKPFAKEGDGYADTVGDDYPIEGDVTDLTLGALRRASEALAALEAEGA